MLSAWKTKLDRRVESKCSYKTSSSRFQVCKRSTCRYCELVVMESICPIDSKCAAEISALLAPPTPQEVQDYFDNLISTRQCRGIKVKQNGSFGKGIFADMDFKEEELVLKDQMLLGSQHTSNKIECFVCSFCFQFIGSIEIQIGRRLYLQNLGVSVSHECEMENHSPSDYSESDSSDGDKDEENKGGCSSSISNNRIRLPKGIVESLMNGNLLLPFSIEFPLPPAVPCIGGCGEAFYCCKSCAESDWELSHSLLCTGKNTAPLRKEALLKFTEHANETNDIFLLAAKAISSTVLKYRKLKGSGLLEQEKQITPLVSKTVDLRLLLEAWKPFSMGHKKKWWDCIALPVDVDSSNELDFRIQIREMALKSLQLLKSAIFDKECEPLFSLEIYGHIIGMFELNNLDLVVASPVEDYFLYIDDLPSSEKKKVEITQQIFDALGEEYSSCCEGTAFYSLQSCMNHSCSPNAYAFKREEDRDGQATIIARRPIRRGEEITISYVDEELPIKDRQALLADYGFECKCRKCLDEQP